MLAQQRASGALEISGNPGGTVFLSGGYLTFAESPVVPDLRSRLISSRRLTADQWNEVIEGSQAHGGIGALLVSRDILTWGELRDLLQSIALDVLIALAVPLSAEPLMASIRFWPRRSHWIGSLLRLDVTSALADAGQKAAPLARHNLRPEALPRLCDLNRSWAVARPRPWAIAWQIDGRATIADLAWRNGFALGDTMELVGELIQAGLCTVAAAASAPALTAPAAGAPAAADDTVLASASADDGAGTMLPQRKPGAALAARSARAETPDVPLRHPEVLRPPPEVPRADLLHRILKGLKRIG